MVFRSGLLIPYFIIFLSVRECLFPIQLRQWCRNHIGVFPLGLNPDGFPCFKFDLFGLKLYRDHDHEFTFSKSRKGFESQIWDPGDSKFKTETGGIRPWISHICGNLFPFVAEIGILVVPDVDVLFHLLRIPFGIREISKFKTRDISLRSAGLYQFGFCWIEMSDVVKLVLNGITPPHLMEKKKNSQTQWFPSRDSVPLFEFGEEEKYVSDPSFSNRQTKRLSKWIRMIRLVAFHRTTGYDDFERLLFSFTKLTSERLHQFSYSWIGLLRLQMNISKYGRDHFTKQWKDKKESVMIAEIYDRLIVVATNKSWWYRIGRKQRPKYLRWTLIWRELLLTFKTRDINLGFGVVMAILLSDQLDAKTRKFEMFFTSTFRISGRTQREKALANSSDFTEKRTMDINEHQWVGRYRRHDSESFQATYQSICSIKVMRKAFRSFIYKMIACYKCMKRGLNRFILLPVRLLLESRVTSTSSSKLGFNFLYLFQRLYLNFSCIMYHVNLFMK